MYQVTDSWGRTTEVSRQVYITANDEVISQEESKANVVLTGVS